LESKAQKLWDDSKAFEVNAPTIEEHANSNDIHTAHPKFMACMPYPYMNGRLHLGHAFTFSKVEYAVGYERMKGKRALLPQGFHCTGMPIKVRLVIFVSYGMGTIVLNATVYIGVR
jgi:leucyl-tRNA synthetase